MNFANVTDGIDLNTISEDKWIKRYYNDMRDLYCNCHYFENPLIYEYCNITEQKQPEELLYGITKIYPGKIVKEYFMTKGHFHQTPVSEVYYCIEGTGLILQQDREHNHTLTRLTKGELVYCQNNFAHRAINIGNVPLVLLCVTRADAGHDYNFKFSHRLFGG